MLISLIFLTDILSSGDLMLEYWERFQIWQQKHFQTQRNISIFDDWNEYIFFLSYFYYKSINIYQKNWEHEPEVKHKFVARWNHFSNIFAMEYQK